VDQEVGTLSLLHEGYRLESRSRKLLWFWASL